jgi:hypothetical protein
MKTDLLQLSIVDTAGTPTNVVANARIEPYSAVTALFLRQCFGLNEFSKGRVYLL